MDSSLWIASLSVLGSAATTCLNMWLNHRHTKVMAELADRNASKEQDRVWKREIRKKSLMALLRVLREMDEGFDAMLEKRALEERALSVLETSTDRLRDFSDKLLMVITDEGKQDTERFAEQLQGAFHQMRAALTNPDQLAACVKEGKLATNSMRHAIRREFNRPLP